MRDKGLEINEWLQVWRRDWRGEIVGREASWVETQAGNEGRWSVEWEWGKPGLSCSSGMASLISIPESLPGSLSHLPAERRAQSHY